MRDTKMSPSELTMAKDAIVRALPDDFETGSSTVSTLSGLFVYDLGLDYYSRLAADISAVTADSAQAAARKYINPDRLIVVVVGDRARIEPGLRELNLGKLDTWTVR